MDKAGRAYWDTLWNESGSREQIDPNARRIDNYPNRRFNDFFSAVFGGTSTGTRRLLEVGCARSAWLPYFADAFGFTVHGIDYSELGCRQATEMLAYSGVSGEITCADFFSPPTVMLSTFDVVISFGVAEHFTDTKHCIAAFSRFLKPGGILITVIPNIIGLVGLCQKILNRQVYLIHVPLDRESLAEAHQLSGLKVDGCRYFLSTGFGVCNLNGVSRGSMASLIKTKAHLWLTRFSKVVWLIEQHLGPLPASRLWSPYIVCTALKPKE